MWSKGAHRGIHVNILGRLIHQQAAQHFKVHTFAATSAATACRGTCREAGRGRSRRRRRRRRGLAHLHHHTAVKLDVLPEQGQQTPSLLPDARSCLHENQATLAHPLANEVKPAIKDSLKCVAGNAGSVQQIEHMQSSQRNTRTQSRKLGFACWTSAFVGGPTAAS